MLENFERLEMNTLNQVNQAIVTQVGIAPVIPLYDLRTDLAKSAKKTGQVLKAYAGGLCSAFDLIDNEGNITSKWFELKGKLKSGVNDERKLFVEAFKAEGFGEATINVYWQRVKEASGYETAGNKVSGGAQDVDAKTLAELKTLINRIFKAEEAGTECKASEVKGELMTAYAILGGNIDDLG
jgi:hypothetical protein